MPAPAPSLHVYAREIRAEERSSLSVLASLIRDQALVLDLGCGTGALGHWFRRQHRAVALDGVTLSTAEAEAATPAYGQVVVGDLETLDLENTFAGQRYDAIVCADVLEHLRAPERVLAQCRALLAPGGEVLISIPNAAYGGLIAELMEGRFTYRDEGLLDRTHLRFFTRESLVDFLASQGWAIEALDTIERPWIDSEFRTAFDTLPPAVVRHLQALPDAQTYQFIVRCRPGTAVQPTPAPATTEALPQYSAELFADDGSHGFTQQGKRVVRGVMGQARQTLRFALGGTAQAGGLARLRLDPADRPGFWHLHGITLADASGQTLWHWDAAQAPQHPLALGRVPHQQIHWTPPGLAGSSPLLLLLGDDPWFELPIPPDVLARLGPEGGHLHIDCGWPMSADYLAASHTVGALHRELHALHDQQARQAHELDALRQSLHHAEHERSDARERVGQLLDERARLLTEQQELRARQRSTQAQLDQLSQHLRWIENSTVFRLTRPLVRLKMALTRPASAPPAAPTAPHTAAAVAALTPPPHPVDVIVPVYRGLEDTRRCITSALASPCATPLRLIVINDASPEPEVTDWLRDIATTDTRITLLENAENLGFVGTVNRGMAYSDAHDVVLLNSDTEVANDWLDRLRRAAYSDAKVGTVTPWSNNATICSYPRFCTPSPLPADQTTASLDALCAELHPGAVLDVPTGVGFCMYIRRDCLQAVGLFDVERFGKGYGEENDFCRRAFKQGWRNLHALDTFVLHAGGVSFGASKSAREIAAQEILRELHPEYDATVMRYVSADAPQAWRHQIDLARLQRSPLPKVLAVTHDRGGGTLRHVLELAQHLQGRALFLSLRPASGGRVRLEWAAEAEGLALEFDVATEFDALVGLLRSVGVGLVHLHHLLGHHPRIHGLAAALGVPYDFTAHDHYSYCPQISLTLANNRYCGEQGVSQCQQCLQKSPAPGGVDIATWREQHAQLLRSARHVLAPSRDTAARMHRFVPVADVRFAPHTDLAPHTLPTPQPPARPSAAPLKVAVIGALSVIKGADVLEQAALLAAQRKAPVEFHLLGYGYRSLLTQPRAHLTVHGAYEEADLPELLAWLQPDLVWFPAQWPETYSYTLSATLDAGLPAAAVGLGAFTERLAGRVWSWVQPWDWTAEQWLAFFTEVHAAHFVPGTAPAATPPAPAALAPTAHIAAWSYEHGYLPAPPTGTAATPLPARDWLHAHRPGRPARGLQGMSVSARQVLLQGVLRLRSAPGLRGLARRIPLRWQTRVKNWLVR